MQGACTHMQGSSPWTLFMNFLPLALVTALLHVYIGARLVPGLGAYPAGQWLLMAGLALSALLMPLGLMAGLWPNNLWLMCSPGWVCSLWACFRRCWC
jgi:hypothetical protein